MIFIAHLFFGLWFFLPAGVANVVPIFASRIPIIKKFSYPIDAHLKVHNIRILGDNKTFRGFLTGITLGIVTAYFQSFVALPNSENIFKQYDPLLLGFLLSFGALTGDAVKSFFKRRIGIRSGKSWLIADQIDYILGAILFTLPVVILPWYLYIIIVIEWFCIHVISTYLGFKTRLKKTPI